MATTNAQIIAFYKDMNNITEEIHTFQGWKSRGYMVKRGEKSRDKLTIWKHTTKKITTDDGEETEVSKMFMKNAAFFRRSQVEKIG